MSYYKTLEVWSSVYPHIVVSGTSVTDLQIVDDGDCVRAVPLVQRLIELSRENGLDYLVIADPGQGLFVEDLRPDTEAGPLPDFARGLPEFVARPISSVTPWTDPVGELEATIRNVAAESTLLGGVVVLDASRFVARLDSLTPEEHSLFTAAASVAQSVGLIQVERTGRVVFPPVYWICESERGLPNWYVTNLRVRNVPVLEPTLDQRQRLAESELPGQDNDIAVQIAKETDKFTAAATRNVIRLIRTGDAISVKQATTTVRLGSTVDHWRDGSLSQRVLDAERVFAAEVIGQPTATRHMAGLLGQAATGTKGLHLASTSRQPRLITMFSGPTGVGKTELTKVAHRFVFGSGEPTTLDMSSYSGPESSNRLSGAAPGFVGYEAGGELTNAVAERPYQLLLFDEIEKMHEDNWDVFLQVFEEGRLTGGDGNTRYFDQTGIVLTSNIGMMVPDPRPNDEHRQKPRFTLDDRYEDIRSAVITSIEDYFNALRRPEIFHRIGRDNFIVFDLLRPNVARQIFDKMLATAESNFRELCPGSELAIEPEALDAMREATCEDLSGGGRAIRNGVESNLNRPLSNYLLGRDGDLPPVVRVTGWNVVDGIPVLQVA